LDDSNGAAALKHIAPTNLAALPDAQETSAFKIKKSSDKYTNFTQQFPFYKFKAWELYEHISLARSRRHGGDFEDVTIDSLVRAFASNESDKKKFRQVIDELQREESPTVKYLNSEFFRTENGHIEYQALCLLIMLMCKGTSKNKARIFYNVLQDGSPGQLMISANDKDLEPAFRILLNVACKAPLEHCGDKKLIENFDESNFDDVFEQFIDKVFDVDSICTRDVFEKRVRRSYSAVFNPKQMRKIVKITDHAYSDEDEESEVSDD
jgi:hypothetical protein